MAQKKIPLVIKKIDRMIMALRGKQVILDMDLAELYEVETRTLNQAVKRNRRRFPEDFMFRLTEKEKEEVITNCDNLERLKYSPKLPSAFTEQGVAMLSSVLRSSRAIDVNIEIMRAFVRLRQLLASHTKLASNLLEMEKKYDEQFRVVFDAIRALMAPPKTKKRKIGFMVKEKKAAYGRRSVKRKKAKHA